MSNVSKFNENLFNDWSKMDLSDYEKEYFKKFNRTSKSIETYYEQYVELYNSDNESSSNEETDSVSDTETETKVVVSKPNIVIVTNNNLVNVNTSISSFFMEFNGFKIRQRPSDGYIHATDMCKVGNKLFADYNRLKETKNFIKELDRSMGFPIDLIQSIKKGKNDERGTWIHPRIAINLAQWISAEFAVKVTDWVQKFIEGDVSLITDAVKQREKVQNVSSSISLVEISNKIKLSESEKQFEFIQMHKNNINELQKQLNEKEGIIIKKDQQINRLENLLIENNIKFDKLLDFATEQKQIAIRTEQKLTFVETTLDRTEQKLTFVETTLDRTEQKLTFVETTLDRTEQKLTFVETTLDRTEQKLDKAVSSIIERKSNKKYDNYLCVYKLRVPERLKNTNYQYYVTRNKTRLKRDKYDKYILDSKYEKVICEIKLNHSVNSWYIIKDKLENERKVSGYRNYFFIYENEGISVISEKEFKETLNEIISQNKNRIKQ